MAMEATLKFIQELGFVKGLFAVFFVFAHIWLEAKHRGRLADRQKEIDRLAQDNREYRNRFLHLMDKKFDYAPNKPAQKAKKKKR